VLECLLCRSELDRGAFGVTETSTCLGQKNPAASSFVRHPGRLPESLAAAQQVERPIEVTGAECSFSR